MRTLVLLSTVAVSTLLGWWAVACASEGLPRFTEEREAAALFFVKKHLPELMPLLEQLRKNGREEYQREIRELFQVTELLADLGDDLQRHDLELKIWTTENKARVLIARLSTPSEAERKAIVGQLQELARLLVNLDVDILDLKADRLDRELGEVKDEVARIRDNREKYTKDRYDGLLQRVQKRRK
jgi:hypothetical protein